MVQDSFAVIESLVAMDAIERLDRDLNAAYVGRFAQMLPGTTTKLVKILRRNFHAQSHKIKAQCFTVWTSFVTSILNDDNVPKLDEMRHDVSEINPPDLPFLCDPKWLGSAQDHLLQHMQIFATMTVHSQISVREALLNLCHRCVNESSLVLRNTWGIQVTIN